MDWQGLSRKIAAEKHDHPHALSRCEHALGMAREALQLLSAHGYVFHLAEGAGESLPDWPRKLFHVDLAPNGRLVFTQQEAEELGAGWFDTLARAQFWDGMETQFQGRGGVPKSPRVPAVIYAPLLLSAEEVQRVAEFKRMVAEFKAAHRWEKKDAEQVEEAAPADGSGSALDEGGESHRDSPERGERVLESGRSASEEEEAEAVSAAAE